MIRLMFAFVLILSIGPIGLAEEPISRIAVGSCAKQDAPQPIWYKVVDYRPELFLFIGDNIYGDTEDMEVLKQKYALLGAQPGYKKLKETSRILATWDDHDYGVNDGGAEYPKRAESQQVFCEFFEVPADSPRRQRPGIYDAQVFGPEGQRVQVILLDTRYFRSPLKKWAAGERPPGAGPYTRNEDPQATMLGEAQWKWLAEQLRQPAELRVIASSIQFVPNEHHWELWQNFPHERQRMLDLIAETKAEGVLFVSGDRHLAEISKIPAADSPLDYPLYDLTASSLNRPGGGNADEPNRWRVGKNYREINFGTITIDWTADDPTISLEVHDAEGKVVREAGVKLSELSVK